MEASAHPRNAERLAALHALALLDTPRAPEFDEITELVSVLCDVPIAVITLVDQDRQWFLSDVGLGIRSTPVGISICAHAILQEDFFEIPDLTLDPRFCDNPLVAGEPKVRFYAGAVLRSPGGLPIGTLCALDYAPRVLDAGQRDTIEILARRVMAEFEVRRRSRDLLQLADQLTRTLRDRDAILAVVAHDLRSPLAVVTLTTDIIERDQGEISDCAVHADRLREAAQRMHRLVDDLMDFSSMRDGALSIAVDAVDVEALVRRAVDFAQLAATQRGIQLDAIIAPGAGGAMWDADRITQVLENLVGNALKFSADGQPIRVEVDCDAERVFIDVIDQGEGIAPESLSRIFEPLVQGDADDDRGVGLGMALVRGIVESHGGAVSASSALGEGTRVRVRLPRDATHTGLNAGT